MTLIGNLNTGTLLCNVVRGFTGGERGLEGAGHEMMEERCHKRISIASSNWKAVVITCHNQRGFKYMFCDGSDSSGLGQRSGF